MQKTFTIRTITVDYSSAVLPDQQLANGLIVKAKGTSVSGVVKATKIRVRHTPQKPGHSELEGLVSGYDGAAGTFSLNNQAVQLTSTTIFTGGAVGDIADGIKVEVTGDVTNGILVAHKVEIDRDRKHGLPAPTPVPTPTPAPLPGKSVYDTSCAGCHTLGTYDAAGFAPNLSGKGGKIAGKIGAGHNGVSLTSQQIIDVAEFVNAN